MKKDDLRYCNCADCGKVLLGESCRNYWMDLSEAERLLQPLVYLRLHGRPYCLGCSGYRRPPGRTDPSHKNDAPPSLDDGVRALEGE